MQLEARARSTTMGAVLRSVAALGVALVVGGALQAGCGEAESSPARSVTPDAGPPDGAADGSTSCEPGTLREGDGRCVAAGIEPEECAPGFVADGLRGCAAVLPATGCGAGQLAVPGDTVCRDVASCGAAPWGDGSFDAGAQYVDGAYAGGDSDGTSARPWTTVQAGVDAAAVGGQVVVAAGDYAEDVAVADKAVRVVGRCPSLVALTGTGTAPATLRLESGADASVVSGLAVTGAAVGVRVFGAGDVRLERVWIHDTGNRGVDAQVGTGAGALVIVDSLVEAARDVGVIGFASEVQIERSVVRGTRPAAATGIGGRGVVLRRSTGGVETSVIEGNRDLGFFASGSTATLTASVVRDTKPESDGTSGRGVVVQNDGQSGEPSDVTITGCVVVNNQDIGVLVQSSRAVVDTTVVADTLAPDPSQLGAGFHGQDVAVGTSPARLDVKRSVSRGNRFAAMSWFGVDGSMERTLCSDTLPAADGQYGRGVLVAYDAELSKAASVTLRASVIERSVEVGAFVQGSTLVVEDSVVRATAARPDGEIGRGIAAQAELGPDLPAELTVTHSRVEDSHEVGIHVDASSATLHDVTVIATHPRAADGLFGDGIEVSSFHPTPRARAEIVGCRVEASARSGLSCFSSDLVVEATTLRCNPIDIAAQTLDEPYALEDRGGNRCGCESDDPCQVDTAGIEPPASL